MRSIHAQLVRFGGFIVNVDEITFIGFDKNSAGDKRASVHLTHEGPLQFFDKLSPEVYATLEELREFLPTIQDVVKLSKDMAEEEEAAEELRAEAEANFTISGYATFLAQMLSALGATQEPETEE